MQIPITRKGNKFTWDEAEGKFKRLWLTGAPGVGKSHIANHLEKVNGFQVLRIGQILRKEVGEKKFLTMKNPHAPTETNARVAELIQEAIENNNYRENCPLVIDSGPRNISQLKNIPSFVEKINNDLVLFVHASEGIRNARISHRPVDSAALALNANSSWEAIRSELISKLVNGGVPMTTFENEGMNG